jgi:MYXO-CTERM domain-containing protein
VKETTGRNGVLALLVLIPAATSVLAEEVSDSMTEGSTLSTGGIRVLVFLLLALGAVLSRRRRAAGVDSAPTITPPG